jgi:hypothetical protein
MHFGCVLDPEAEAEPSYGTVFVKLFVGPAFKRTPALSHLTCLDFEARDLNKFSVAAVAAAVRGLDTEAAAAAQEWAGLCVDAFGSSDLKVQHVVEADRFRFVMGGVCGQDCVVSVFMTREVIVGHLRVLHDLLTWRDADAGLLRVAVSNKEVPDTLVRFLVEEKGAVPDEDVVEAAVLTGHASLVYVLSKVETFTRASCVEFAIANIAAVGADDARRIFADPMQYQVDILKCLLNHVSLWAQVDTDRMVALAVQTHDAKVMRAVFLLLESKGCSVCVEARHVLTALEALKAAASTFEAKCCDVRVVGPLPSSAPSGPWAATHVPFRVWL